MFEGKGAARDNAKVLDRELPAADDLCPPARPDTHSAVLISADAVARLNAAQDRTFRCSRVWAFSALSHGGPAVTLVVDGGHFVELHGVKMCPSDTILSRLDTGFFRALESKGAVFGPAALTDGTLKLPILVDGRHAHTLHSSAVLCSD